MSEVNSLPLGPCQLNSNCNRETCVDLSHEHHADDWFEDPGSGKDSVEGKRRRRAMQACWWDCPTARRLDCLDRGLQKANLGFGIWGGYTEAQRQEIDAGIEKRRQRRAATSS